TGMSPQGGVVLGLDGNLYGTTMLGGPTNAGTIFRITPSGSLTTLYAFDFYAGKGMRPDPPLVLGNNGSFYGLANPAVAFSVTPSGVYKAITTALPASPSWAGLIQAKNGNLYSTTYNGGTNDSGTIFQLTPSGSVKIIYNFDTTHGGWGYAPLVSDSSGYLYGTEAQGGATGGGVVFKTTTSGTLKVLHNFIHQDPVGGWNVAAGLVLGNDGNLYGSTSAGGSSGYGVLYKISRSGSYQQLYSFDLTHGAWPTVTAMQHTNGKIYGLAGGGAYTTSVLWSLDAGLKPFVKLMQHQGSAGNPVGILGQGFTGASKVVFGGGAPDLYFTVVSDTYVAASVPPSAITGPVTVITPSGSLVSNISFKVIPKLTNFIPMAGPAGANVNISGYGLGDATKVTFGGVKASFTVNYGSIWAIVPAGAKSGKIAVTTPGGTATIGPFCVGAPQITGLLVNGVPANSGPPGATLNILGSCFGASVQFSIASLNGLPIAGGGVAPVSWSNTRIDAMIPNSASSGPVVVQVRQYASNPWNFTVTP